MSEAKYSFVKIDAKVFHFMDVWDWSTINSEDQKESLALPVKSLASALLELTFNFSMLKNYFYKNFTKN